MSAARVLTLMWSDNCLRFLGVRRQRRPRQAEPPPTAADSEALATPSTASSPEPAQSASEASV
jgi:hypothetical protein